jgi:hypothetical protein
VAERTSLSLEEHRALGAKLRSMRDDLSPEVVRLADTYGPTSPVARLAGRICDAVDKLRSELAEGMLRESAGWPAEDRAVVEADATAFARVYRFADYPGKARPE